MPFIIKMKKSSNFLKYRGKNIIKNNIFKKILISLFFRKIYQEIKKNNPKKIIDLGCGEGFIENFLLNKKYKTKMIGIDINPDSVEYAKKNNPGAKFLTGDILNLKIKDNFDLVLMLEVLEHLSQPGKALETAKSLSKKLLVSVPWEPWFSWLYLSIGLNLKRLGKHPEHCQFFNRQSLESLLKKYFRTVEVKSNWPWLIAWGLN
jgi:2-polyprenyl-3-methyl-5-hydroxy-6-metoxy-1,4-benzoquinol methylase